MLNRQMNDRSVNTPSSLQVPQGNAGSSSAIRQPSSIGTPAQTPAQSNDGLANNGGNEASGNTPPAQPMCVVNLLGIRALCR